MTTTKAPVCLKCKHYNEDDFEKPSCKAFPDRIPYGIWDGLNNHKKAYPKDKGIRYEPKK